MPQSSDPGITQVAVQIVRPPSAKGDVPRMVVGQGLTSVQWTAPGLAVRTSGPPTADAEKPVTYRVEVSNTGDLPAPNVVLAYAVPEGTVVIQQQPAGSAVWQSVGVAARRLARARHAGRR